MPLEDLIQEVIAALTTEANRLGLAGPAGPTDRTERADA
jgi:hypothetical protein